MMRKELTTIALLQARLDQGLDYAELFSPFTLAAIADLPPEDGFEIRHLQGKLAELFDLQVPLEMSGILLTRAKKKKAVRREAGRYFREGDFDFGSHAFEKEVREQEREYAALGQRLAAFLESEYEQEVSAESAAEMLFDFLEEQRVPLLIDGDLDRALLRLGKASGNTRRIARFISRTCEQDPKTRLCVSGLLQAVVTKQALLLSEVAGAQKSFTKLKVYLDTGVLLGALGFEGPTLRAAQTTTLSLLREAGISLRVFERTLAEIRSILYAMADRVTTPQGIRSLRLTDMTREIRRVRPKPSELRQSAATLEARVRTELSLSVEEFPDHEAKFTEDEKALAQALRDRRSGADPLKDPRVTHDVGCISSVLTMRRGASPRYLSDAIAVFVTKSAEVAANTRAWAREQEISGIPAVVHQHWLSSIIWLKSGGSTTIARDFQAVALLAHCAVVLRPRPSTWRSMLDALEGLVEQNELSSDEALALVYSDLMEVALSRAQDDLPDGAEDPDTETIIEVIHRVRDEMGGEATQLRKSLDAEQAKTRSMEDRIYGMADRVARFISRVAFALAGLILAVVIVVACGLLGAQPWVTVAALVVMAAITWLNAGWGLNLKDIMKRFESRLHQRITSAVRGEDQPTE
jgi:hypothetical protein